jgi:hypothetical protein
VKEMTEYQYHQGGMSSKRMRKPEKKSSVTL